MSEEEKDDDKLHLKNSRGDTVIVAPENVLFAKSLDHWVKVLVKDGKKCEWCETHLTLGNFLLLRGARKLDRAKRFYAVNKAHVIECSRDRRTLTFDNGFIVELEHPLPPYFIT